MNKQKITEKMIMLIVGKKSIKERFSTAFWPSLVLSFILFFFGPLDLSSIAKKYVNYNVLDVLFPCLITFLIVFLVLFFFSLIIGGKLHVWICSWISGLAIAFYIQGNFMNQKLGSLDGSAVEWHNYTDNAIINLIVFLMIMQIPYLIHFFSRKAWKFFLFFSSILLIFMQGIPLGIMLIKERIENPPVTEHYIMAKDQEYTLGKENIVVFILDTVSPERLATAMKKYPDILDPFQDFTSFTDYHTFHIGTFPSATTILTHQEYNPDIPFEEWFYESWHSDDAQTFYKQMAELGWETNIYNNVKTSAGTYENEYGLISNIKKVEGTVPFTINQSAFRKLIKLSFYRYSPMIMKASFWIYTYDLNSMKNLSEDEQAWVANKSIQKYLDNRLEVKNEGKKYIFYHFNGAHPPYNLKANGRESVEHTSVEQQVAGHFYFISQYLQQMKDYHIYDSSSIIITADHGILPYPHSALFIKPAGQRQEKMTYNHAPITQLEFMPTIAKFAGMDKGLFGRSFYDVPEDEKRLRCTGYRLHRDEFPTREGVRCNAYLRYCYIGDLDTLYTTIRNDDFEILPLPYSYE